MKLVVAFRNFVNASDYLKGTLQKIQSQHNAIYRFGVKNLPTHQRVTSDSVVFCTRPMVELTTARHVTKLYAVFLKLL